MEETILKYCKIACLDIGSLDQEGFAMARRSGIGASDTAAVLGAMKKFRGAEDVLINKLATEYTAEEQAISEKPVVRKGRELEPLILSKAEEHLGTPIWKSPNMYRLIDYPYLTINYDGLCLIEDQLVPVEAKFVSTYGDKYYNYNQVDTLKYNTPEHSSNLDRADELAQWHGIPVYYLIQIQQQLLGTDADYAYLAALRDKDWNLYMFRIPRYEWMQRWLIADTYQFWKRVEHSRRNGA